MGRSSGMTGDDAYAILHSKIGSGGGGTSTTDYNALTNKPKLNGVELSGEKLASAFGLPIIYYNNNEIENTPLIVSELEPGVYVSYYGALILKGYADSEEVLERRAINGVLFVYRKFQEGMTRWDAVASFIDDGLNLNQVTVTTQYPSGLSIANIAYIGSVTRGDTIEDIEALWTFQKLPQSEASPSNDKDFTTKVYVDQIPKGQLSLERTIENHYALRRTGKVYQTKLWKFTTNPTSDGIKQLDNAGLVFEPSTDMETGQDDYLDGTNPLFEWVHVNYVRDNDGTARPTAIEGTPEFKTTGAVDVGAMQMSFWWRWDTSDPEYDLITISDTPHPELGLVPWVECQKADGTLVPWCIGSSYISGEASDGLLRSQPGLKPARLQSYSNMITNYQQKGAGYWGAGACRNLFQIIFNAIKGATKNSQNLFAGCTSYSFQYTAATQDTTPHTYFPVTTAQAANIVVGGYVSVGYGGNNNGAVNQDRGVATMHAYADDVKVLRVETLDESTSAVYLDIPEEDAFTTTPVALTDELSAPIVLSSMHWWSGATDAVRGRHDGSPVSNTNGKYPYRVQGREYAVGGYVVAADTVTYQNEDGTRTVYTAKKGTAHSTTTSVIQDTYKVVGTIPVESGGAAADYWIGDDGADEETGAWYPAAQGSSSTQGVGDRYYAGGTGVNTFREYLQGGDLGYGAVAGASYLNSWSALAAAGWYSLGGD